MGIRKEELADAFNQVLNLAVAIFDKQILYKLYSITLIWYQ